MSAASERLSYWLDNLPADDPFREGLIAVKDDPVEIRERFAGELAFGTAGLRGKLKAGTACMNYAVVGRAAQGLADYIAAKGPEAMRRGAVIAHDPRHFSKEFSNLTAGILAANGIRAFIFPDLRPTPELAFLVPRLGTIAGVNLTASHNPKDYNGMKLYWEDGCQVSGEIADAIYGCIKRHDYFSGIKKMPLEEGIASGLIEVLPESLDKEYLDKVLSLAIREGKDLDLTIPLVYTPLNGAGSIPFTKMLAARGFTNWRVVPDQKDPDPDFTTVGYPNPEAPAAFKMSEALGKTFGAELLMATDPDSDRFAIELLNDKGEYVPLNGNQTGYLLVNYLLEGRKTAGTLPENGAIVKSIVTSTLSTRIAERYGVKMLEALTGFKNICGRIPELHAAGLTYLFGYEESVGYAACSEIRDKDGISAGMLAAEAAAYYRKQGKTLFDVLNEIYSTYGFCSEMEPNLILEGLEGAARIIRMMEDLRKKPLTSAGGIDVTRIIDYKDGYEDIPPSNVLRYFLADGSWFAVRPSGTEPKIKFYFYAFGESLKDAGKKNEAIKASVTERITQVE